MTRLGIEARSWDDGQVFLVLPTPALSVMEGRLVVYLGAGQTRTLPRREVFRVSRPVPGIEGHPLEQELHHGVGRPGSLLAGLTGLHGA